MHIVTRRVGEEQPLAATALGIDLEPRPEAMEPKGAVAVEKKEK